MPSTASVSRPSGCHRSSGCPNARIGTQWVRDHQAPQPTPHQVSLFAHHRTRRAAAARIGLAIVLGRGAIVVFNDPNRTPGAIIIPVLIAIAWVGGFVVRERATQAEAAEVRATHAERERESAARTPVTLTGAFTDPDAEDTHVATVDYGDGTVSNPIPTTGQVVKTHIHQQYHPTTSGAQTIAPWRTLLLSRLIPKRSVTAAEAWRGESQEVTRPEPR